MKGFFGLSVASLISFTSQISFSAGESNYCASQAYKNLQFYMNIKGSSYMCFCRWISGDYYSHGRPKGVECDMSVKDIFGRISNWSISLDNQCRGLKSGPNSIQLR